LHKPSTFATDDCACSMAEKSVVSDATQDFATGGFDENFGVPLQGLPFSRQTVLTARPTEEVGTSTMQSTPSQSNHWRAIAAPTSGLG
jgi:hypothetical protein